MSTKQTEALKLALGALEVATTPLAKDRQEVLRARAAIREALAEQPAQDEEQSHYKQVIDGVREVFDAKRKQQPAQEPVAWKDKTYGNLHHQDFGNSIPLYTSPPDVPTARASKPLTFSKLCEIEEAITSQDGHVSLVHFARAIEAAHGIKEKNA